MNIILFDGDSHQRLLPLTFTRPVGNLRIGILTINEKWEKALNVSVSFASQEYLSQKFPMKVGVDNIVIYGGLCPDGKVEHEIVQLKPGESLSYQGRILAVRLDPDELRTFVGGETPSCFVSKEYPHKVLLVENPWDIFSKNDEALRLDYRMLTLGRTSQSLSSTNTLIGEDIFIEEGAEIEGAIINTKPGPVYVGKGAEIMEGVLIRGGLALGEHSTLKMGAKIYGATTIGPHSKAGGEISNSIIYGYSNKGHDGFIGNTVIGEWCNLGADTNTSNLKNNYAKVKLWNYASQRFANTGLQFCGLIMGDHSKCGINTMFNTGTVVGVSANIYGSGFPRNFIPSFSWGGSAGMMEFQYAKAAEVAQAMMDRRNVEFSEVEQNILQTVFELTANFRQNLR
jgi:UDP-N-acetylglucosamine diphosphorylase/glucosamine-1-phosphate N-acetyltransferase